MYEELGSVREAVAMSPQEALDSAEALLVQQGYEITQRTEASVGAVRLKREGMFGHSLRNLTVAVKSRPQGGVEIKLRGNDQEGVREKQNEWSRWSEALPKLAEGQQELYSEEMETVSSQVEQIPLEAPTARENEDIGAVGTTSETDRKADPVSGSVDEHGTPSEAPRGKETRNATSSETGRWVSVGTWDEAPPVAASKQGPDSFSTQKPSNVEGDRTTTSQTKAERKSEDAPKNKAAEARSPEKNLIIQTEMEKHTVRVGLEGSSVGETVSFTANLLGTAHVNGGKDGGGMDYTFYRLPDGNFRVLIERDELALLVPSDMDEALDRGQRSNYKYGRMTLEEMKEHEYNFGEVYDQLMENHPETVRNRIRDLD